MDIETLKLIIEITVIPCITFISTLSLGILSSWVSFQFSKSLERYKKTLSSKDKEALSANESKSDTSTKIIANDSFFYWVATVLTGGTLLYWVIKIITRGTIVIANLFALTIGTVFTFFAIRPFGINFISNRINDLIQIPRFFQLYYEVTQFFPIEVLVNLYLFGIALTGGLILMLFTEMVLSTIAWILS